MSQRAPGDDAQVEVERGRDVLAFELALDERVLICRAATGSQPRAWAIICALVAYQFEALSEAAGVDLSARSELGRALMDAQGELLSRAQAAGAVREDIDTSDLKALVAGCLAMQAHGAEPGRMVEIVCAGLRP